MIKWTFLKSLLLLVGLILLVYLGIIWDMQARPFPNTTLYLQSDNFTGDYSLSWSGDPQLVMPDNSIRQFEADTVVMKRFDGTANHRSIIGAWRAYALPLLILIGLTIQFLRTREH